MTGPLVHVPTVAELGLRGLARERTHTIRSKRTGETREDTRWEVTAEGFEEIRAAMAHNAALLTADPGLRRERENAAARRHSEAAIA